MILQAEYLLNKQIIPIWVQKYLVYIWERLIFKSGLWWQKYDNCYELFSVFYNLFVCYRKIEKKSLISYFLCCLTRSILFLHISIFSKIFPNFTYPLWILHNLSVSYFRASKYNFWCRVKSCGLQITIQQAR